MRHAAALAILVSIAGCFASVTEDPPPEPSRDPPVRFGAPVVITPDGGGSEPGILAAADGSLYVVEVLGSVEARGDGLWKSTDRGATWTSLGKPDYPFGGGDADLDEDPAGTLYLPGQWRPAAVPMYYVAGGESMAVSRDKGRSWIVHPLASDMPVTDRQWSATQGNNSVWLAFNQAQRGLVVTQSPTGGLTWRPLQFVPDTWTTGDGFVEGGPNGIPGDLVQDDARILIPYGAGSSFRDHRVFGLRLLGGTGTGQVEVETFRVHTTPPGERALLIPSLARDDAGGLYYAWAETVTGGNDGTRIRLVHSSDAGKTWSAPIDVTPPGTTSVFPWLVAGAPGRVAVSFYAGTGRVLPDQAPRDFEWRPFVAFSDDVRATEPRFEYVPLSAQPNHVGALCTGGAGCASEFRRLGDFFESGLTPDGRVVVTWVDDTKQPRVVMFAAQQDGALR